MFKAACKVQVNNANSIDPHKAHHAVHPQALANESQYECFRLIGELVGPPGDPLKESSASADDFDTNWVDIPGGADYRFKSDSLCGFWCMEMG